MARNERRRVEWAARLARWRTSGLSVRRFCLQERVSQPTFYQWRKRLRDGGATRSDAGGLGDRAARGATFLPIEVVGGSATDSRWMEIRLPSGVTLRVPEGVTEARVGALVRVLRDEDARC